MLRFPLPPTLSLNLYRSNPITRLRSPIQPYTLHPTPLSSLQFYRRAFVKAAQDSSSTLVNDVEEGEADEELQKLLVLLPEGMRERLDVHPELHQLVEIVMDLGRSPLARFPSGDFILSDNPITLKDIHHATSQVGDFTADNRAGISRTLHRISAIRNRKGIIVGLTCRVGRAISGSANLLRDLIECGESLLLIGPPGVGKTTVIREVARILADELEKRVMIVDTSNEIGGDGDVPHSGIGSARRMQVPNPNLQHMVLIEAVENHMPQVIVIDEIGTKLEAAAASTIAQRGIQLVATAHGVTIENLMINPSLEMLVGGIQSVTLGDDEASRRGVQKTVLERKGPATFTCGVEIISKTEMRIHRKLEATVDALLSGKPPSFETRKLNSKSSKEENPASESLTSNDSTFERNVEVSIETIVENEKEIDDYPFDMLDEDSLIPKVPICLYAYGILEITVLQAMKKLKLDEVIRLTDNISEADVFLAFHSKLKKNSRIQAAAKSQGKHIYVLKTSSLTQIAKLLRVIVAERNEASENLQFEENKSRSPEEVDALEEARLAIEQEVIPNGRSVDLLPRPAHIILAQMVFVREYKLSYEKVGNETNAHLRILPLQTADSVSAEDGGDDDAGLQNGVIRLPLLPG